MEMKKSILAIVTTSEQNIKGGGAPVFIVKDHDEIQHKIFLLENILDAMGHELDEQTFILVKH
ncbi:capping complex subunit for YIEGIA [Bacillus horti]|uniref:Uncharacterized protein n=1 Tax=Caldalkalibacillus horti TaxID=77523 RepID=A0ABT9W604_9BACI|nr:hypothetical protein [Bacillus horti]MDQ0168512.1 hypothetical protein [Bacillus horti]